MTTEKESASDELRQAVEAARASPTVNRMAALLETQMTEAERLSLLPGGRTVLAANAEHDSYGL